MKKLLMIIMILCLVTTASAEGVEAESTTEKWYSGLTTCLIVGVVIGGISVGSMAYNMKSVRDKDSASDYVDQDGLELQIQQDRYLYSTVSRRPRPKQNSRK